MSVTQKIGRTAFATATAPAPALHLTLASRAPSHRPLTSSRTGHSPTFHATAADALAAIDWRSLLSSHNRPARTDGILAHAFLHTGAAAPHSAIAALADPSTCHAIRHATRTPPSPDPCLRLVHLHTEGALPTASAAHCSTAALFVGANARAAVNSHAERGSHLPFLLSQIPHAFDNGDIPVDVACIQVSPPDAHGYCSLGVSVDVSVAAVTAAPVVVAQINRHMPRTHGSGLVHVNALDFVYEEDRPLPAHEPTPRSQVQDEIGRLIAEHLVRDGACLQMGIGAIPDAVLANLGGHRDLGIHTEMFSSGLLPLVQSGVVNNVRKGFAPNHVVSSFLVGSQELYDFVDDNPLVQMLPSDITNDPRIIRTNRRMTAINSAIEVDLTGQVCAESLGHRQHSGVGGQMDFMRGAQVAKEGCAIIALPSTVSSTGASRIVSTLQPGAAVTTTRAHVQFVVTEWGIAELRGRTLGERARALIDIAHPDHRARLTDELRALPL